MPQPTRPMHRHNIWVVVTGPIEQLGELQCRQMQDDVTSAVSYHGFARESQRHIVFKNESRSDFRIDISLSDALADMSEPGPVESIEAALVEAVAYRTTRPATLGEKFQRHPTPTGDIVVG